MNEEKVHVHEETSEAEQEQKGWTDEFVVAGSELLNVVKQLIHETTVRRLVIKNEAKKVHLEIPLVLGLAGIWLLPIYSAVALIAALVTDCTILVERAEKAPAQS